MLDRRKRSATFVRGFLFFAAVGSAAAADDAADRVRLEDPRAASALRGALGRARQRLARTACQRVLSEFMDGSGQTLQSVLDRAGQSSVDHLAELFFYDGSGSPQCQDRRILAFTSQGSHVILVCPEQFRSQERKDSAQLDVVIIHETLHTLGLGENPPTAQHISQRVFSSCVANASRER